MPKATTASSSSKANATTSLSVAANAAAATAATHATTTAAAGGARTVWERTFSNGDTYHGEALHVHDKDRKPVKDGKGRYTWASSGAVYDGEWKEGLPHGAGVMSVPGSDGYEYTGAFKTGKRSGKGRCAFTNGRVYDGEWREDEMNGQGTLHGATNIDDFVSYTGAFCDGKRSGQQGRCVYANGDVYDGAWAAGKRHGVGEWHLHQPSTSVAAAAATRQVRYRGLFDRDAPQACSTVEAELEYADGSVYTGGTDAQMRRHGKGVHRLAGGDVFEGSFAQDRREGRGVLQGSGGAVCEGPWHNDQPDGAVHIVFAAAAAAYAATTHRGGARVSGTVSSSSAAAAATSSSASLASLLRLNQPEHAAHPMATYDGPCVAGILTGGPAVITYVDGSSYNGAVRNGVPHGAGVLRDRPLPRHFSAGGADADGVVRKRIPVSCIPLDAPLTLTIYEGTFSNGEPDGSGAGDWRAAPAPVPSPASPVAPQTFMDALGRGLRGWPATLYAGLDGSYTGQWARGLPHGQGTWRWSDGSRYTGAVAHYVPSGSGALTITPSLSYTGDLRDGQAEGSGVWEDKARGLRYDGAWLAGQPHGAGTATLLGTATPLVLRPAPTSSSSSPPPVAPPSRVYEGTWVQGRPAGHGTEYVDAARQHVVYEGGYADGYRAGEGTLFFSVGDDDGAAPLSPPYVQYTGAFSCGAPGGGGAGCLALRTKTTVAGCFDARLRPLAGAELTVTAGNEAWVFRGVYDAASHTGRGVMTFANGDVYDGEVEDVSGGQGPSPPLFQLQRHGSGTYRFVEGNRLRCTWRHNVLHGGGTYTSSDGVQTERHYADGVLTGDAVGATAVASGGVIGSSSSGGGGGGGGAHVEADTGVVKGNVFTPENEFPNTLSAEALKSRNPELQQQSQQQPRKRQPFAFTRKGEARQASAAGEITGAAVAGAAAAPSPAAPAQRVSPRRDSRDGKRHTAPPVAAGQQRRSSRTSPPREAIATGDNGGSAPSANAAAASPSRSTPKYSLRRQPQRTSSKAPAPAAAVAVPTGEAGTPPPTAAGPAKSSRLSFMRRSNDGNGAATPPTAYLSSFQAGIHQLDRVARAASPSPSTASGSPTPTATRSSLPVTTPAGPPGSRGRLSSALAEGRAQQRQEPQRPSRPLKPLEGSLKALMDAASAIRSTREDEIHLLTEEMRELNERIWQLRFTLTSGVDGRGGGGGGAGVYAKASTQPAAASPEGKRSSASAEALAALVQERRVILEKLRCVVNEPDD
ncbi:MORN repeat [Novymonas esmeraldas]|uniref:MORN repeat n=1 Tax=Novymonas esmeraldas TaxID=1808958 RepID=A0AAW0F4G6_9TRYP